jgi:helicase required for RNAi-mediated heterochromatin assembly 1
MAWEDEINSLPEKSKKATIKPHSAVKVNKDIAKYFDQPHAQDPDTWTSQPWILKSEIPSSDEIFGGEDGEFVDLEPNKIDGPWDSKEAYLKAHYDLIREDAVAPLRDAVATFKCDPDMGDDKNTCIYEKVRTRLVPLNYQIITNCRPGVRNRVDVRSARPRFSNSFFDQQSG